MQDRTRAYRRHQIARVANNRRKLMRAREAISFRYVEGGPPEYSSDNALAVRHPLDCGKRCYMCHGDKLLDDNARRQREGRVWQIQHAAGEGVGFYDEAIFDWTLLRADDAWEGLPRTVEEAERQDYSRVYDKASGICLGDLSDMDTRWDTGEAIVEVENDYGHRFWIASNRVEIR